MSNKRLAILGIFATLTPLWGQSADSNIQSLQIGSVTFSGSIRERAEVWDWFGGYGENYYAFSGTLMQFALSQTSPGFEWKLDIAVPVLLGLPNQAVKQAPQGQEGIGANYYASNRNDQNAAFIFPKQAYVRFKHEHKSLQLGRFEFNDGAEVTPSDSTLAALKAQQIDQRLIGIFGFSDVQRSFDGFNVSYSPGAWNLTAVAAIPTRGVYQVDGWGWVTTPFAYLAATRQVKYSAKSNAEWRLFGIYYEDPRNVLKTDNRTAAVRAADHHDIRIGTYGAHYIQDFETDAGTFDLLGWCAVQTGQWGTLRQRSGAFTAQVGLQPKMWNAVHPWFGGGYYYGSGDENAKDGIHGTFVPLLYTPRAYALFPFFNEMNNRDAFGQLIVRPAKSMSIQIDGHKLSLASANDLWYTGGGAYQPWTFGYTGRPSNGKTDLANLYDAGWNYTFTRSTSIGLYYGYAQGGAVIKSIYKNVDGQLGFIELDYQF